MIIKNPPADYPTKERNEDCLSSLSPSLIVQLHPEIPLNAAANSLSTFPTANRIFHLENVGYFRTRALVAAFITHHSLPLLPYSTVNLWHSSHVRLLLGLRQGEHF